MLNKITIKSTFNAPIEQVFELLSKHATLNEAFAPAQVKRIIDANDPQRPDGVGSVRSVGFASFTAVKEQITLLEPNQKIEYQIIDNPLVRYHLGQINFEKISERETLVVYHIALQMKIPGLASLILAQLKFAIKIGFAKLNKRYFAS